MGNEVRGGNCHLFRIGDLGTIMQRPQSCNWPIKAHMKGLRWKLEGQCQQAEQLKRKPHHGSLVGLHCCSEARHKILYTDIGLNITIIALALMVAIMWKRDMMIKGV